MGGHDGYYFHLVRPMVVSVVVIVLAGTGCRSGKRLAGTKATTVIPEVLFIKDDQGNRYAVKKLKNEKLWMTMNLNIKIPASYCYDDNEDNCKRYGRLYTWNDAQKLCRTIEAGWRLPSRDEWLQLTQAYGGGNIDSTEVRKNAYQELMPSGSAQFNAMLAGGRDDSKKYGRCEAHGFYWSATAYDSSTAWFANFAKGSQALYLNNNLKSHAHSVRCVKSD
jgi:uncharacterized protein (TIGR02145 family)